MGGKLKAIKKYKLSPVILDEMKYIIACAEGKVITLEKHEEKVAILEKEIKRLRNKLMYGEESINKLNKKLMKK